jgi:hypothetical protein
MRAIHTSSLAGEIPQHVLEHPVLLPGLERLRVGEIRVADRVVEHLLLRLRVRQELDAQLVEQARPLRITLLRGFDAGEQRVDDAVLGAEPVVDAGDGREQSHESSLSGKVFTGSWR